MSFCVLAASTWHIFLPSEPDTHTAPSVAHWLVSPHSPLSPTDPEDRSFMDEEKGKRNSDSRYSITWVKTLLSKITRPGVKNSDPS